MAERCSKRQLQIEVSGYLTEILSGQIPAECKDLFIRHLLQNRIETEIPKWLLRRNPNYVSPEEIKQTWYFDSGVMREIVKQGDKEMYQVSWYSPHEGRWLNMDETGFSNPKPFPGVTAL